MRSNHYRAFIEEAFIDPIRSVLIVDDDYPTYDDILDSGQGSGGAAGASANKAWRKQPDRVANLIGTFRRKTPPLLVDVHDGANVSAEKEEAAAEHLHQCDLLVLDYELDKAKSGDGTRAIKILRSLMSNNHFNLVVIYTVEDLDVAFDSVRWGLVVPSANSLTEGEVENARQLIFDGQTAFPDFDQHLSESVGSAQYFHSRLNKPGYLRTMAKGEQPYTLFKSQADRVEWCSEKRRLVLQFLLNELENREGVNSDSAGRFDSLEWSPDGPKWIKSDSAFVTFSSKRGIEGDLLSDLKEALVDWNPRPSRLLLTKLRAEIDEYGVAAQRQALSNHHALAYWYYLLLQSDSDDDRRWRIAESVSRHSDQLLQAILPRVEEYTSRLIRSEKAVGDATELCADHFDVDLSKKDEKELAALEHNAFVCSVEPSGWHLDVGHIFSVSDELWLCLSPACDMVPTQIPAWRRSTLGNHLPFVAVKLHPSRRAKALSNIHSNQFLCLRVDGDVNCYCFNDGSQEDSAPHWQIFYAEQRGEFSGESFKFTVSRIEKGKTKLVSKRLTANVISQLRYEYALNLMQKLGVSLTRVGLDFADGTAAGA